MVTNGGYPPICLRPPGLPPTGPSRVDTWQMCSALCRLAPPEPVRSDPARPTRGKYLWWVLNPLGTGAPADTDCAGAESDPVLRRCLRVRT